MFLRHGTILLLAASLAATIAWLCPRAAAQRPAAEQSSGLIDPQGIAFNPASGKVYVVDQTHGAVDVIDTATQAVHSVAVGAAPVSIAADSANGRAYVANSGTDRSPSSTGGPTGSWPRLP